MFLIDFRTRKYTGGIISRVGIFLTVTPETALIRLGASGIESIKLNSDISCFVTYEINDLLHNQDIYGICGTKYFMLKRIK